MVTSKNKQRRTWVISINVVIIAIVLFFIYQRLNSPEPQLELTTNSIVLHNQFDNLSRNVAVAYSSPIKHSHKLMLHPETELKEVSPTPTKGIDPIRPNIIPNEYILSFKNEDDQMAFIQAAKAMGMDLIGTLHLGNSVRIKVDNKEKLDKLLESAPEPSEWSSNYIVKNPEQDNLDRLAPQSGYQPFGNKTLKWLGVNEDNSAWGKGITIAILDTGILKHLALNEDNITRIDLTEDSSPNDQAYSHGTAVASLIAGVSPDLMGIAPSASLLSIKVLNDDGGGDTFTLARGIVEAADRGAQIINICLGTSEDNYLLRQAINYAIDAGSIIVAATGNDAVNSVSYPAKYSETIAVGGIDGAEQHLYFSNRGEEVDIAAPGFGLIAAGSNDGLAAFSGTSASTPLVSATLAWILSKYPDISNETALNYLLQYTDDAGSPGKDDLLGNGILDIRRINEKDTQGIYDIAAGMPYVNPSATEPIVILYCQNRGTEQLAAVDMHVQIDGLPSVVSFYNLAVGETVSTKYNLNSNDLEDGKSISIICTVTINGFTDANPFNNTKRCNIFANPSP